MLNFILFNNKNNSNGFEVSTTITKDKIYSDKKGQVIKELHYFIKQKWIKAWQEIIMSLIRFNKQNGWINFNEYIIINAFFYLTKFLQLSGI